MVLILGDLSHLLDQKISKARARRMYSIQVSFKILVAMSFLDGSVPLIHPVQSDPCLISQIQDEVKRPNKNKCIGFFSV